MLTTPEIKSSLSTERRSRADEPGRAERVPSPDRPDAEAVERALYELQDRYPDAPMVAVSGNGLIVALPDSVRRRENPVLSGRSGLDSVPAEDRPHFIEAFDCVLNHGVAQCALHPPGFEEIIYHGFDLRERHGVIVGVLTSDGAPSYEDARGAAPDLVQIGPPRFMKVKKDERSFVIGVAGAVTEILGWNPEEMEGHRSLEFIHEDDHALAIDNWMEMMAHPGPGRRVRQRLRHKDGSWVWFEVTNHNLLADPDHHCVVSEMVDISDEMAAQEALRAREELLRRLAETVPVGLLQTDPDGRVIYTNDRLHEILGVEPAASAADQLATVVVPDRPALERALEGVLGAGADADIEVAVRHTDEPEPRFCKLSFRALRYEDGNVTGAIVCVSDVTESARMREELSFRATFDELTGCHNRASIMAALAADIGRKRRRAERAVMFIDLDGFKSINDRYGHAAGDRLLQSIGRVLRESVRDGDCVGRTGGDEFLVLCPDVGGADRALKLAGRIARALRAEGCGPGGNHGCRVSIGVAFSSGTTGTADALVAAADQAMYRSKRAGTGEPELASVQASV